MERSKLISLILSGLLSTTGCISNTGQLRDAGTISCPGNRINLTFNDVPNGASVKVAGETIQVRTEGLGLTTTNQLAALLVNSEEIAFTHALGRYTVTLKSARTENSKDVTVQASCN